MDARASGQLLALAVKVDLPQLLLQRIALIRGEIDHLPAVIHDENLADLKVAPGQLALQFGLRPSGSFWL